ncbi:MAG: glycosyl transferase group 1 [Alphaproteobacteria bacterium]|nr:glycosyl transferase group 1 [Alphaproteobacteria bacterium]
MESFTSRLATELLSCGHHPEVVTQRLPGELAEEMVEGIAVHRFDFTESLDFRGDPRRAIHALSKTTAAIAALKQRVRPDIVHVNFTDGSPIFHVRTPSAWPSPTIVTFHANLRNELHGAGVARTLLESAARITAVSCFAAEHLVAAAGLERDRIEVIAPGVRPSEYGPGAIPVSERDPNLLFIGRLAPGKGADIAIRALKEVDERVTLTLVGDGPERARLEQLVFDLRLGDRVHFLGEIDTRRHPVLQQAFALIVPSDGDELFGMVAVEAGLCAVPVIASSIGGLAEIVEDGVTGYTVPPGDPAAIANAIRHLVENPARAQAMGNAGRDRALRLYTAAGMFQSYLRLYRACLPS